MEQLIPILSAIAGALGVVISITGVIKSLIKDSSKNAIEVSSKDGYKKVNIDGALKEIEANISKGSTISVHRNQNNKINISIQSLNKEDNNVSK